MNLSKANYYADFVVYPLLLVGLGGATLIDTTLSQRIDWFSACLAGVAAWTLTEYMLHRFVLHRVRFLDRMHDAHHQTPTALIGTPTWLSVAFGGLALMPLWRHAEHDLAGGVTAGLVLGYLWYVSIHHMIHHWRIEHGTYLYRLKRRHAQHHYSPRPCNFGVTTSFWDRVFGSDVR